MFLNNEDFFLIRRLILTDLLDHYNALKLTNKVIVESKRQLLKIIRPDLAPSKKRKMAKSSKTEGEDEYVHKLIDEFENEADITRYYTREESKSQKILFDQFDEFEEKQLGMHLFLDAKEHTTVLDLKREVIMTMLNSLEKIHDESKRFFKFEGILPAFIGMRFHKSKPQELAETDKFIKAYISLAKEHQGVYRCST